jgi:putative transposase
MKRRKFTAKFKTKVVLEAIKESKTLAEIAQHYKLAPTQISKWEKEFLSSVESVFSGGQKSPKSELDSERDLLLKTIGELQIENDFLKNVVLKSLSERRKLIDPESELSKRAQCRILGLHRSGIYYENRGESALNLELMRLMDLRYHYHPYEGAPRMHDYLTLDEGYEVSFNRVARLYYEVMGLRAIIPSPYTSKRN